MTSIKVRQPAQDQGQGQPNRKKYRKSATIARKKRYRQAMSASCCVQKKDWLFLFSTVFQIEKSKVERDVLKKREAWLHAQIDKNVTQQIFLWCVLTAPFFFLGWCDMCRQPGKKVQWFPFPPKKIMSQSFLVKAIILWIFSSRSLQQREVASCNESLYDFYDASCSELFFYVARKIRWWVIFDKYILLWCTAAAGWTPWKSTTGEEC